MINHDIINTEIKKGIDTMKKYKVEGFSHAMDIEMKVHTVEEASDLFDTIMDSDIYYKGRIVDNTTGELCCYFTKEEKSGVILIEYWTAFE